MRSTKNSSPKPWLKLGLVLSLISVSWAGWSVGASAQSQQLIEWLKHRATPQKIERAESRSGWHRTKNVGQPVTAHAPASTAPAVYWTDWTSAVESPTNGRATGTISLPDGSTVTVNLTGDVTFAMTNGAPYWVPEAPYLSATVPNSPVIPGDMIAQSQGTSVINTITFSRPVQDVLISVISLNGANHLFNTPIEVLSSGCGYWGCGSLSVTDGNTLMASGEGHGTIRIPGSHTSFSFQHTFPEFWVGFTIGIVSNTAGDFSSPNLAVSKSNPSPALVVGQNSTYNVTVTNNGNAAATTATVREAIPAGLDLIGATGANWSCTPSSGSGSVGTITCSFGGGTIPVGGASTINVVVRPQAGTGGNTVTNNVSVDPTGSILPPHPTTCTGANAPYIGCGAPVTSLINSFPPGVALDFDGVNDYVSLGNLDFISTGTPGQYTVELWVKLTAYTPDYAWLCGDEQAGNSGVAFEVGPTGLVNTFHPNLGRVASSFQVPLNTWTHLALVQTATSVTLYANDNFAQQLLSAPNLHLETNAATYLGRYPQGGRLLQGQLDEVRFWNRPLCQSEIQQQMNCELVGTGGGLSAYYKFNQGFAGGNNPGVTTATDAGPFGSHGTLNNFALSGATSNWVAPGAVVTGTSCNVQPVPEINVRGNGTSITNGDNTPSAVDDTDFGSICVDDGAVSKTFTIENTGAANLTVSSISSTNALFVVNGLTLPATIVPGAATTFTVSFDPAASGVQTTTININNNDCNESPYNFVVRGAGVVCNQPPVARCKNVTVAADASCSTYAFINDGSFDPDAGDSITVTQSPAGPYSLGNTTVTLTVTDNHGASSSCTAIVKVVDYTKPTINAPAAVNVSTGAGATACGVVVSDATLGTATASDNCSTGTVTRSGVPAGNFFPVGTTTITYIATDAAGNTETATQTVKVTDYTKPTLSAPAAVNALTGAGSSSCSIVVSDAALGTATASDNCGTTNITRTGVPAGNFFPVGTTTITYTATDGAGNTTTATQTVTVADNTAPKLTPPPAVNLSTGIGATTCGVLVSDAVLGTATASDNCGTANITRTGVPAGNLFPVGTTIVTYKVTDAAGNMTTATQTVTVVDNTAPVITTCATKKTLSTNGASQVALPNLLSEVVATDNCTTAAALVKTQSPAAGTMIGLGNTTVTITVKDAAGNGSICSAVVTVVKFNLGSFVVFSSEYTKLNEGAKVYTGNVGANSSLPNPSGGADDKEEVEIGERVRMLQAGSNVVGDTVRVRADAQVYNIHFNEKFFSKDATILGSQVTPQALPVLLTLPTLPTITPGTGDIEVQSNQTLTLAAGSYRKITVKNKGTLVLTGGAYHVATLDIRQEAKLYFTGPTEVRVKNEMDTDSSAYIGPAPSAPTLKASQIVFYVAGVDDEVGGTDLGPTAVQIGEQNTVKANIYAPNGTVWLRANAIATGAFIGKRARIGQSVELRLESAFY